MIQEKLIEYSSSIQNYLIGQGMVEDWAIFLNVLINCVLVAAGLVFIGVIFRRLLVWVFTVFSNKTKSTFDDFLVQSNFPRFIARLLPLAILWYLIPILFAEFALVAEIVTVLFKIYLVILWILIFRSILRSLHRFLEGNERFGDKPMESYVQV